MRRYSYVPGMQGRIHAALHRGTLVRCQAPNCRGYISPRSEFQRDGKQYCHAHAASYDAQQQIAQNRPGQVPNA